MGASGGEGELGILGLVERLEAISRDRKTPAAVQVAAIRAIADLGGRQSERPRSTGQVEALTTLQLHQLHDELAHLLPPLPEPAAPQG